MMTSRVNLALRLSKQIPPQSRFDNVLASFSPSKLAASISNTTSLFKKMGLLSTHRTLIKVVALTTLLSACELSSPPLNSLEVASKGIHAAALSDDGQHALIGSIYHGGSLWNIADSERLYNWNHTNEEPSSLVAADFSNDGRWALSADNHTLVLWDVTSGKAERYWVAPGEILDAKLGPNADTALLGLDNNTAVIFDIRKGGIKSTFIHQSRVRSVDYSRDGRYALTGSEDYTASLWDTHSSEKLFTFKHNDDVQLVKLSPDGSLALTVSKYDKALLWETKEGKVLNEIPLSAQHLRSGTRYISAQFSNDSKYLLTGRPDRLAELWKTDDLSRLARWKVPKRQAWKPTSSAVIAVSFSTEANTFFAVTSNGFVHKLRRDDATAETP